MCALKKRPKQDRIHSQWRVIFPKTTFQKRIGTPYMITVLVPGAYKAKILRRAVITATEATSKWWEVRGTSWKAMHEVNNISA